MKMLSGVLICFALSLLSNPAAALLEARVGYEMLNIAGINNQDDNLPSTNNLTGLTADGLVILSDYVIGLRYENLSGKKTSGSNEIEAKFNRTSVVLGYRLWDTGLYFGPIATVGVLSTLNYKTRSAAPVEYKNEKMTLGLGIEGGVHLLGLLVGGEIGYLSANMGNLKYKGTGAEATGAMNAQKMPADLSGVYARVLVGLAF